MEFAIYNHATCEIFSHGSFHVFNSFYKYKNFSFRMNGFTTLRLQIVSNTLLGSFLMTMSFVLSLQTSDNFLLVTNEEDRGVQRSKIKKDLPYSN